MKEPRRLRPATWIACFLAAAGCSLNPQPEPPSPEMGGILPGPPVGSGTGGSYSDAGAGRAGSGGAGGLGAAAGAGGSGVADASSDVCNCFDCQSCGCCDDIDGGCKQSCEGGCDAPADVHGEADSPDAPDTNAGDADGGQPDSAPDAVASDS
jgi:hypothetical protein